MDNKNNQHSGGGNGFLLGVIVGVVIALLFTTKRGRQILHVLTEKGFEKFSDLQEELVDEEDEEGDDYIEDAGGSVEEELQQSSQESNTTESPVQQHSPKQIPASTNPPSTGKRFFRKK